jgi:hypothetical protein
MIDERERVAQKIKNEACKQMADNAKLCSTPIRFPQGDFIIPDLSKDYEEIIQYAEEMVEE